METLSGPVDGGPEPLPILQRLCPSPETLTLGKASSPKPRAKPATVAASSHSLGKRHLATHPTSFMVIQKNATPSDHCVCASLWETSVQGSQLPLPASLTWATEETPGLRGAAQLERHEGGTLDGHHIFFSP